ncbi:MAG: glycerophosphodiester phosphodiesterase family protein [Bacteroidales bacterium]|nr:glycerophosphodiester phosphodiesterase family protein [Bacteroidales bacterium]
MIKNYLSIGAIGLIAAAAMTSCSDEQQFVDYNAQAHKVDVQVLPADLAKVRDYVPLYAVIAHRGSTYWTPEETEASWRWARDMGADYLESDLQATKDGVVLSLHDDNLKRTTNIQSVFSDQVPDIRRAFYRSLTYEDGTPCNFSEADINEQYNNDLGNYYSYYPRNYYYAELLMLDAGAWFNEDNLEQARASFASTNNPLQETLDAWRADKNAQVVYTNGQYISALADQIAYAEGKKLNRDAQGRRILPYHVKNSLKGKTLVEICSAAPSTEVEGTTWTAQARYMDFLVYDFSNAYVADDKDSGNRPGIYIEFKESWAQPKDMEARVYKELDKWGWNIITKPEANNQFYKDGKVNVGNTNGKVILQSFSFDATNRAYQVFKGRVPFCYLLWTDYPGDYATDIKYDTPTGVAAFIKTMQDHGCHIIGPAISGAPNNYPEMNCPWQAYMVRRAGMINHPYSFDSQAQITKYMGYWNYGLDTEFDDLMKVTIKKTPYSVFPGESQTWPIYMDGCFTNHTEMNLQYMIDNGMRCNANLPNPFHPGQNFDNSQAPSTVPNAVELLNQLGY